MLRREHSQNIHGAFHAELANTSISLNCMNEQLPSLKSCLQRMCSVAIMLVIEQPLQGGAFVMLANGGINSNIINALY